MNYIDVPAEYRISKEIPISKFNSNILSESISSMTWEGSIKPEISGVAPVINDTVRYEEIQFFHCELHSRENIFSLQREIAKAIKYPCVIEFQVDDATTIGICEFRPNKSNNEENVLRAIQFSHWLHEDILSPEAKQMLDIINSAIRRQTDMKDIYHIIDNAICNWRMGGTSRAHVDRIIYDMIGNGKTKPAEIRKYCKPYEYHKVIAGVQKYGTQRREKNYSLIHDYEEIWYCLMKCPETKEVIEGRRYRGVEDLFYSIDSKGW